MVAALAPATRAVVARALGELPASPTATLSRLGDNIALYYYCDETIAVCGVDLPDLPEAATHVA
ncbi:hypothetical protein OG453_37695 [Streptomyces sp. NBC_01381]|uniref:hypothetical protein n=1 Tax=Streptomyces sp. NBC_01381 TaxID=2903845 RepID=UPI002253FBE3|nr:hypothetical protein [Streptomyces sp. NBC_01381]MCX4672338.1 hypothetical protein [Streptomyces sp. NBC_01381]